MDIVEKIMEYEEGEMGYQDTVDFFQDLYDTGMYVELQGHYGRQISVFLEAGIIRP